MTPANSTSLAAYGAKGADSPMGESVEGFNASAGSLSSGGYDASSGLLTRHTGDRTLTERPQSICHNDALNRYTTSAVDPVLSIPVREYFAPTHLQWRCTSEPSRDDVSPGRTNSNPMPRVVMCPHTLSSDNPTYVDVSPGEAGAVGDAAEIITNLENLTVSSSDHVCSRDTDDRDGVLATSIYMPDESWSAPESGVVGETLEITTRAERSVDSSSGGVRSRDVSHEEPVELLDESTGWFDEICIIHESGQVSEPEEVIAETIGPAGLPNGSHRFLDAGLEVLFRRQDQAHAQLPVEIRQAEAVEPAADAEPKPLCDHYHRRCYVRLSCCSEFFACHRCHNYSGECDNREAKASSATHLKCAECRVVQEINNDSRCCSNCKIVFSEYFCAKCKHFTSKDKKPGHCEKCGICRIDSDKSFHCDVCNVCLHKKLEGNHGCRPGNGHEQCCVCFEDVFSGCRILPCSHKIHQECALALVTIGVRSCPLCCTRLHPTAAQR